MTPVESKAIAAYMDKFPNVFEIVNNSIYFIDKSISARQLFIKRMDNDFLFLDNFYIDVRLSRMFKLHIITVSRDFKLSDAACVSIFDAGIQIRYYDNKNNYCFYDEKAIRRRHFITNIIENE